jgi:hypothetical protein
MSPRRPMDFLLINYIGTWPLFGQPVHLAQT